MIPVSERMVESTITQEPVAYFIAPEAAGHVSRILRNMYKDPMLSVFREYLANALDAHEQAGILSTVPVEVDTPSRLSPVLKIRDHGPGMTHEETERLLLGFGMSGEHKRASNRQIGGYGVGCKSAFSVTDAFTYTIWHGGTKTVMLCSLGSDDMGEARIVSRTADAGEETGVLVAIPVPPNRIDECVLDVRRTICHMYGYAITVNGERHVPMKPLFEGRVTVKDVECAWRVFKDGIHDITAPHITVAGFPYENPYSGYDYRVTIPDRGAHCSLKTVVDIPTGAVQLTPTRESLQKCDRTENFIDALVHSEDLGRDLLAAVHAILDELELVESVDMFVRLRDWNFAPDNRVDGVRYIWRGEARSLDDVVPCIRTERFVHHQFCDYEETILSPAGVSGAFIATRTGTGHRSRGRRLARIVPFTNHAVRKHCCSSLNMSESREHKRESLDLVRCASVYSVHSGTNPTRIAREVNKRGLLSGGHDILVLQVDDPVKFAEANPAWRDIYKGQIAAAPAARKAATVRSGYPLLRLARPDYASLGDFSGRWTATNTRSVAPDGVNMLVPLGDGRCVEGYAIHGQSGIDWFTEALTRCGIKVNVYGTKIRTRPDLDGSPLFKSPSDILAEWAAGRLECTTRFTALLTVMACWPDASEQLNDSLFLPQEYRYVVPSNVARLQDFYRCLVALDRSRSVKPSGNSLFTRYAAKLNEWTNLPLEGLKSVRRDLCKVAAAYEVKWPEISRSDAAEVREMYKLAAKCVERYELLPALACSGHIDADAFIRYTVMCDGKRRKKI